MSENVKNGRRVPVSFAGFAGEAGVQDRPDGNIEVAFAANLNAVRRGGLREGTAGEIDGVPVHVVSAARGQFVPGMVKLICRASSETGD